MKLEQSFTVEAPPDVVYEALCDVARVAPCLPGAEITDAGEDGTYSGTFTVKIGPTTASYNGSLKMDERDDAARRAVMSARGTDKRGQGGASATIVSVVHDEGGVARVEVDTDFTITGKLARFGRGGMIQDISNRLLREFAACLQSRLATEQPAAAGSGEAVAPEAAATAAGGGPAAPAADALGAAAAPPAPLQPPPMPAPAKPISGLSLFFGALLDRIRRLFRRRPS